MASTDMQLAGAVLSRRYEEQLFAGGCGGAAAKVVPALVLTGFLGSGKTTLLQHLLAACGSSLKLGVLVNEVAEEDVDSQLVNARLSNAAVGVRSAQLAGGCACCTVSGDLQAALAGVAGSSSYQHLDYLLLETSGVADAEPLAAALSAAGFRLTAVVAVLDAEAADAALQQDVAVSQLRAADVVVLNKCDLASLGQVAAAEDRVQELAPGVRMLRARFGQVPPEALLDLSPLDEADSGGGGGGGSKASTDDGGGADGGGGGGGGAATAPRPQSVQGEVAFLSHEPQISSQRRPGPRPQAVALSRRRQRGPTTPHGDGAPGAAHAHTHAHTHSAFGSCSFASEEPMCMACFQAFTADTLLRTKELYRAKGILFFQQQRTHRYVFHLSGKQRAECGGEGAWQGPPRVGLVLIGLRQGGLLEWLRDGLERCLDSRCGCSKAQGGGAAAAGAQQPVPGEARWTPAAARFAELVGQHHQFELVGAPEPAQQQRQQQQQQQQQQPSGLVQFSAVGSALHGVVADEVNAGVLRRFNATPGLFLCHVRSPPALQADPHGVRGAAMYQGVARLQACFPAGASPERAERAWREALDSAAPVLRKAYQHVHNCKCDVAAALQVMAPRAEER